MYEKENIRFKCSSTDCIDAVIWTFFVTKNVKI